MVHYFTSSGDSILVPKNLWFCFWNNTINHANVNSNLAIQQNFWKMWTLSHEIYCLIQKEDKCNKCSLTRKQSFGMSLSIIWHNSSQQTLDSAVVTSAERRDRVLYSSVQVFTIVLYVGWKQKYIVNLSIHHVFT